MFSNPFRKELKSVLYLLIQLIDQICVLIAIAHETHVGQRITIQDVLHQLGGSGCSGQSRIFFVSISQESHIAGDTPVIQPPPFEQSGWVSKLSAYLNITDRRISHKPLPIGTQRNRHMATVILAHLIDDHLGCSCDNLSRI